MIMKFPGGKLKALTFSYDDGVTYDKKLVEILKNNGLKGTFNVCSGRFAAEAGGRKLTAAEIKELYLPNGMEVAVHGLYHRFLQELPDGVRGYEMMKDRENLEELLGVIVRGMAYAYGNFGDEAVAALKNAGLVYGRTTKSTGTFDIPRDWLRLCPTCHHCDERLDDLADKFLDYEKTVENFPWRTRPQLFYVWGHSYEFNDNKNWYIIEKFADRMAGRDDIWNATNIEIYDYANAYNSLVFSCNGKIVHNPTAWTLYVYEDGQDIVLAPGDTVTL